MKVLHLSYHLSCKADLEYVFDELGHEHEFLTFSQPDGQHYNMTHDRANYYWRKYKDYFHKFDCIVTSDTAPLSRIFLQNNWKKKLIIWVCNRFDYSHQPCVDFPDEGYYKLIRDIKNRPNVEIVGYTPFENHYAKTIRNLPIGSQVIKPTGCLPDTYVPPPPTNLPRKDETFLVGPYHNDNVMLNLKEILQNKGIRVHNGRYEGPLDLAEFKGVVHIPYAWSNFAVFEGFKFAVPFFLPSLTFLENLRQGKAFFWSPPYRRDALELSEWYLPAHKDLFIYFDSWEDLQFRIQAFGPSEARAHKNKLLKFASQHATNTLKSWKNLLVP